MTPEQLESMRATTLKSDLNQLDNFKVTNGGKSILTKCTCKTNNIIQMRDNFFTWYDNEYLNNN